MCDSPWYSASGETQRSALPPTRVRVCSARLKGITEDVRTQVSLIKESVKRVEGFIKRWMETRWFTIMYRKNSNKLNYFEIFSDIIHKQSNM